MIARQAAAAGDVGEAAENLEHALPGWRNPPIAYSGASGIDAYCADVPLTPESDRPSVTKRDRVGPVYGELFHSPGWWSAACLAAHCS